jgi:hypothetical protein
MFHHTKVAKCDKDYKKKTLFMSDKKGFSKLLSNCLYTWIFVIVLSQYLTPGKDIFMSSCSASHLV